MPKVISLFAFAVLAALLASCATTPTPKIFTDADPEQDFSGYQTFAWMGNQPMIVVGNRAANPVAQQRIATAIEQAFAAKGYRQLTDASEADFVIAFTVGARDKLVVSTHEIIGFYGRDWRWGRGYHGYMRPAGVTTRTQVSTHEYTEGSLAIDVFDGQRKSPVWHGMATKRLSPEDMQGDNSASIKSAVQTILSSFPPE